MIGDSLQGPEPDREDWRRFHIIEAENSRLREALQKIATGVMPHTSSEQLLERFRKIAREALEK